MAVPHTDANLLVASTCAGAAPGSPISRAALDQPSPADDGVDPAREEACDAEQRDEAEARVGHEGVTSGSRRADEGTTHASAVQASTMSSTSSSWWACASGIAVTSTRCAAGMSECGIQIARMPTCWGPCTSSKTRSPT